MSDVVTTQSAGLPAMPDYLKGYSDQGIGMPEVDIKEIRIPMLKMIQLQGEMFDAKKDNFGNIYDSVSLEDLGSELEMVVVDYQPTWIRWEPQTRKMLGYSENGKTWERGDLMGQLIADTEGKDAFKCKHYNYYVLLIENGVPRKLPYKVSFSGMSAKAGDRIYQIIATKAIAQKLPMFAFTFMLRSKRDKNDSGQFSVFEIEMKKDFTLQAVAKVAAEMYEFLKSDDTKIVEDDDNNTLTSEEPPKKEASTEAKDAKTPTESDVLW